MDKQKYCIVVFCMEDGSVRKVITGLSCFNNAKYLANKYIKAEVVREEKI